VRGNAHQLLERIKARNQETFWSAGWRSWAPWVPPLVVPLTILLLPLLLEPHMINLLTSFIHNRMDTVKLQLVRLNQRLPLDDIPETVIRDYDGQEEGIIRKLGERSKLGKRIKDE
jgi:hypothetical protein